MTNRLIKLGNNFAIRIKKSDADQLGWKEGTQIHQTFANGRLIFGNCGETNTNPYRITE